MNPKEKAQELFEKFRTASRHKYIERTGQDADEAGKTLAIICVEQIIDSLEAFGYTGTFYDDFENGKMITTEDNPPTEYFRQVLSHLQNS